MFSFIIKNTIKKLVMKMATDKDMRERMQTSFKKARQLNSKGELIKTLGKAAGRLRKKIK